MKVLLPAHVDAFSARFSHFDDGVIRKIIAVSDAFSIWATVELIISVRDVDANWDWINIQISLSQIESFALLHNCNAAYNVLSNGIHIEVFEDCFCFEFGDFSDAPTSLEEYKQSRFYVIAGAVEWNLAPYSEQVTTP